LPEFQEKHKNSEDYNSSNKENEIPARAKRKPMKNACRTNRNPRKRRKIADNEEENGDSKCQIHTSLIRK